MNKNAFSTAVYFPLVTRIGVLFILLLHTHAFSSQTRANAHDSHTGLEFARAVYKIKITPQPALDVDYKHIISLGSRRSTTEVRHQHGYNKNPEKKQKKLGFLKRYLIVDITAGARCLRRICEVERSAEIQRNSRRWHVCV